MDLPRGYVLVPLDRLDDLHRRVDRLTDLMVSLHNKQAAVLNGQERLHRQLTAMENVMSKELDDLAAAVERDTAVDQSAITLLEGLKAQLDAAGTDKVKLKALSDMLGANQARLAAAVAANTPAAEPQPDPETPVEPPPVDPNAPAFPTGDPNDPNGRRG